MRNQCQQLHHGRVQPGSGNHVEPPIVGKHRPACAIHVAAVGIEDHPLAELGEATLRGGYHNRAAPGIRDRRSELCAEIPRAEIIRRDGEERGAAHALESAFPIREKEQRASLDRSSEAAPVNVANAFGLLRYASAILIPPKAT